MGSLLSNKNHVNEVSHPEPDCKVSGLETKILLLVHMGQKYKQKIREQDREIKRLKQSLLYVEQTGQRPRRSSNAFLSIDQKTGTNGV
jgi:hypothetical protein